VAAALCSWKAGPQSAFERLRGSILEGEYGLEERLVEGQLAERLGVSRTPIPRALTMLKGHAARRATGRISA
jgi:DNA-binding GntR family transcriptional regulator